MSEKERRRIQLQCLYDMFRDKIEENVIYIVYTENEAQIDTTIDQLMSIAACSFTGYEFPPESSTREERKKIVDKKFEDESTNTDEDDEKRDIDERIDSLQESIQNLLVEKKSCHEKASQYLSKKMFPVTSYYSELASQYRRMVEIKTRKLVDLLLLKSQDANSIDLHGLNPIQARLVVGELLNIRQNKLSIDKQGETSIDIITGWGKHTVTNSQHRIKPTIVALLREKGFEFIHLNRGALRVTIRR